MSPDTVQLIVCLGFAAAGWFLRHVLGNGMPQPPDPTNGPAPSPASQSTLLGVLASALHLHIQSQGQPPGLSAAEQQLAALLERLLLGHRAPTCTQAPATPLVTPATPAPTTPHP
jgi:hypothetical protein